MELWWFILFLLSLCLCAALKSFFDLFLLSNTKAVKQNKLSLPPGPSSVPIIGNLLWLRNSFSQIEPILLSLRHKYDPIITLRIGSRPFIFITDHSLAHQALVENGAIFADRPPATVAGRIIFQDSITAAGYGPVWRLLRRNLTSEILLPSRVKSYAHARKWVLQIITQRLKHHVESGKPVQVMDHLQYAMFCLMVFICFGEKLDEKVIREIEDSLRTLLLNLNRFNVLSFFPKLGKIFFRNQWRELLDMCDKRESAIVPIIRSRRQRMEKKKKQQENQDHDDEFVRTSTHRQEDSPTSDVIVSYVDTLLDLQIPEGGGRKLTEKEIVANCSEFLMAGSDTTSAALQWIMASLVKHQEIQEKLYFEIKGVVGSEGDRIKEEDLQKMPYLKAVVLEGLRLHPPGHFLLPHAVTQDTVLNGNFIPKKATVNFMVAEMGRDPKVWKDPMEFKPERFLSSSDEGEAAFDITGSKGIKMIPFGAGRRICPGLGLAMLHLEYFVSNLVRDFNWSAVEGDDDIDFSEKVEFATVMKNPLRAHISPRK